MQHSLQECVAGGGVAVFPSDTVYGVCCDPENERAARRLYELKGRPAARASAVMFFALDSRSDDARASSPRPNGWRCRCCCPGR